MCAGQRRGMKRASPERAGANQPTFHTHDFLHASYALGYAEAVRICFKTELRFLFVEERHSCRVEQLLRRDSKVLQCQTRHHIADRAGHLLFQLAVQWAEVLKQRLTLPFSHVRIISDPWESNFG